MVDLIPTGINEIGSSHVAICRVDQEATKFFGDPGREVSGRAIRSASQLFRDGVDHPLIAPTYASHRWAARTVEELLAILSGEVVAGSSLQWQELVGQMPVQDSRRLLFRGCRWFFLDDENHGRCWTTSTSAILRSYDRWVTILIRPATDTRLGARRLRVDDPLYYSVALVAYQLSPGECKDAGMMAHKVNWLP